MKSKIVISSVLLFIFLVVFFNKKIIKVYFLHKLSNWVERDVSFDDFKIKYPNNIYIENLKIKSSKALYYDLIFEADKISINLDLASFLSGNLRIINSLDINEPKFYLEVVQKKIKSNNNSVNDTKISYEDNIGIAKKLNENIPDKIWPAKKRDINFLILETKIYNGIAFIKISSIYEQSKIFLSDFEFTLTGNQKENQHYKDDLKIMLFDILARESNLEKKKILKKIYKF